MHNKDLAYYFGEAPDAWRRYTLPENPSNSRRSEHLREQIEEVLQKLPERERKIIQLRYGLKDGRYRTLEEVGVEFGITRERIRQIEAVALRKLRHPHLGKKLRGYLD